MKKFIITSAYSHIGTSAYRHIGTSTLLLLWVFFAWQSHVNAQNLGLTSTGSTSYPTSIIGNNTTGTTNAPQPNYLVCNKYTANVPLTAISIYTWGNQGGNGKVAIYSDNGGTPGNKLTTEVSISLNNGSWTLHDIADIYLPAGTYWIASNITVAGGIRATNSSSPSPFQARYWKALTYSSAFPATGGSGWNTTSTTPDCIYIQGIQIQGYAKATKATLPALGSFSTLSFYSHATGNARLAIYSDAGGVPSAKQWESSDVAVAASAWTTLNISAGTPTSLFLAAGTYWLAWQWNTSSNGPSYTAGAAGDGNYMIQAYGAFPASWSGGTSTAEKWSEYASYCNAPATPTAGNNGPVCEGFTLSLTASTVGGASYSWTGPNGFNSALQNPTVSSNATTAMSGIYTVTPSLSGCAGAPASTTATVNAAPLAQVNGQSNPLCNGGADGTITLQGSGGTSPYSFSTDNGEHWVSPGVNPYVVDGLSANVQYKIRVRDANACLSKAVP